MADQERKYAHFILNGVTETEGFRSPQQGGSKKEVPAQNRRQHGNALLRQIEALKRTMENNRQQRQLEESAGAGIGLQIEFESFPDIELAFESLARERSGIELLNVRHEGPVTSATVFVPDGKLSHFETLIRDYLEEKRDKKGRARDHKPLINTIREIRAATLRALWTDAQQVFPAGDDETFWWEVWLPVRANRRATIESFRNLSQMQNLPVAPGVLEFPERTVLLVQASAAQLTSSMMMLNSIAELRRAKETAEFFDALEPEAQPAWLGNLLQRSRFPGAEDPVPHICVLDTGVNNGHPLIEPALAVDDLHTVEPRWGTADGHGHGTQIAGLALAGDLTEALDSDAPIEIGHRLESVKLLPNDGSNDGNSKHHGYLTMEAVARPEVTAPDRRRVFEMAVTARDNRDRGRPTAWSAAVDRLASDAEADNGTPRLFVISAGNIVDSNAWADSPASNGTDGIHDPGQAWNALTIGAYTDLTQIREPDMEAFLPIAPQGGLSPFSTTSFTWQPHWPLKPDVVFEGGNAAKDALSAVWTASLSLLTTNHLPDERFLPQQTQQVPPPRWQRAWRRS